MEIATKSRYVWVADFYHGHTAKIWEFPGSGTQICFSTWGPPHPGGVYLAPLASNIPFFAGAFGAYYPSPMPCYILSFPDSGWVFSCKIVSFICFGCSLGTYEPSHRCVSIHHFWVSGWVFSCKILYKPLCQGFVLFMINFNADKSRVLTLNTTIIGFDYWDIVRKNDWMAHTDRDSLWDSYFGTHCWEALFPLGKSFVFS